LQHASRLSAELVLRLLVKAGGLQCRLKRRAIDFVELQVLAFQRLLAAATDTLRATMAS